MKQIDELVSSFCFRERERAVLFHLKQNVCSRPKMSWEKIWALFHHVHVFSHYNRRSQLGVRLVICDLQAGIFSQDWFDPSLGAH